MARSFPLAGLLRLRRMEEEQAAGSLSDANARTSALRARKSVLHLDLERTVSEAATAEALQLAAIARASARSMLADLQTATAEQESETLRAEVAFRDARTHSVGLEKLENKHSNAVAAEDLRVEQRALDEVATGAWHRRVEGIKQ